MADTPEPLVLAVKNWREFQHYAKRRPPWIKLQHRLLDDRVFLTLPVASKALAPLLWLIASESIDGKINDAMAEITYRLRMSEQEVVVSLSPLIAAGFFIVERGAIPTLAERKQLSGAQERREEERQTPTGFVLDSSVETACPVAAREGGPGGADAHDSLEFPKFLRRAKEMPT